MAFASTIARKVFWDALIVKPVAEFSQPDKPSDFAGGVRDQIVNRPPKMILAGGADCSAPPFEGTPVATTG